MKLESKRAIKIGAINLLLVGASILMLMSPLGRNPGSINPIMLPFFFYCMFSFVLPMFGIFVSIKAISKKENKSKIATALSINGLYLIFYCSFIVYMWPRWMSI